MAGSAPGDQHCRPGQIPPCGKGPPRNLENEGNPWWCPPPFRPCGNGNGGNRLRRNLASLPHTRYHPGPCHGNKCDDHGNNPNRNLGEIPTHSFNTVQMAAPIALVIAGAALYTYKWKTKHASASKNVVSKEEQNSLKAEDLA